jgi:small-conductance mechanosensitive channel
MKPASALRLLRWIVLAFVLVALSRASAQETHRLDLEQTRATLTAIETALRDKNLDDAGLQNLRAQSDALSLALQGAIAELTPRLADSAKRLDELTPKSGQPAPSTDVAAKELEKEKQRHDRLDANLRAARAMLLEANDVSTRISEARRQLFAERTFARSSSILNPQLWAAVGRELPVDAVVVRNLIDNWLGAIGERPLLAKIGMAAIVIALALAAAPLGWIARRFVYRDLGQTTPSRLRRALAAAWTFVLFAVLPLAGLGVLAGALDSFDLSDPSMKGVIDAAFEAARVLIAVNALGRGMLAPGRAAWRLVPITDRSAGILYRLDLGCRAVGRACV